MKVYIVIEDVAYDGDYVEAVFLDEAAAEQYAATKNAERVRGSDSIYEVQPHEVQETS